MTSGIWLSLVSPSESGLTGGSGVRLGRALDRSHYACDTEVGFASGLLVVVGTVRNMGFRVTGVYCPDHTLR